jgi:hypothetical protein
MIFKRFAANLRAQNWFAIGIEIVIVIVGVFIGTWVANRNEEAIQRQSTIHLLNELRHEIDYQTDQEKRLQNYMATTGAYAQVALRGWGRDATVSDNDFVIAAYQASQSTGAATDTQSWSSIFGSQQVQNIRDYEVRKRLIRVLSLDAALTNYSQTETEYRKHVREVIPISLQDRIRARCDDVWPPDGISIPTLPPACDLELPSAEAIATAAALRARPDLIRDLHWHRAAVASMLGNFAGYVRTLQALGKAIDESEDFQRGGRA